MSNMQNPTKGSAMSDMQESTGELPPPNENDVAVEMDQQPTLTLAIAGTMEIPGTEEGGELPLLMLLMADGTVRWASQRTED
tara:strand:+ start:63 stop:308 length:246 start_codon:yes stop_codon:yes gene_type:complete